MNWVVFRKHNAVESVQALLKMAEPSNLSLPENGQSSVTCTTRVCCICALSYSRHMALCYLLFESHTGPYA